MHRLLHLHWLKAVSRMRVATFEPILKRRMAIENVRTFLGVDREDYANVR